MVAEALSDFEELFCLEWIKDLNGTAAYMRARGPTIKAKSAGVEASKLLAKPSIVERIRTLMAERVERVKIEADDILRELLRIATVDITQAFDDMGGLKPFKEMPEDVRKALAGLEVAEMFDGRGDERTAIGLLKKVKFWDKTKALELLGKHLKLFTDKVEHSGGKTLAELVADSREESN